MQLGSVNSFALISAGAAGGFRYLNGRTQDGFVQTVGDMLAPFSGTRWRIQEISPGVVTIECRGDFHNPEHVFLDGGTLRADSSVSREKYAPSHSLAHLWGTSAQPSASLQVVTELNQFGADLTLIGANFTPHDGVSFTAEGLVGHGGDMHAPFTIGTTVTAGADGRFEAPGRISFFSPPQPADSPVIIRATDHSGRTGSATTSGFSLPGQ